MKTLELDHYTGREQAYVKHYFLAAYLEALIFKIASRYDTVVYVDGYSGPWQSGSERFSDTSFGIALNTLRSAKETWKAKGRTVEMKAVLVEERDEAFSRLTELQPEYPDVSITPLKGDFRRNIDLILRSIPADAFAFILIDPLGWRIPIDDIAPLLSRPNTEVLFNFMFDFINRAASMAHSVNGLDELLPVPGWREELAALDKTGTPEGRSAGRKRILIDAFRETMRQKGNYPYVAEMPVLRPMKNRTLYSLVYASRSRTGIKVFRDCQAKALIEQDCVRSTTKVALAAEATGQGDMFGTDRGLGPDPIAAYLDGERQQAEVTLIEMVRGMGPTTYGEIWPNVLSRHAVRLTDLNMIAARLRKDGVLMFPEWAARQRVPSDNSRVQLGAEA
jgi:three-Cys-motif partner protein